MGKADKTAADQAGADKKSADKKSADKKSADKKGADKKSADKKSADKKPGGKKGGGASTRAAKSAAAPSNKAPAGKAKASKPKGAKAKAKTEPSKATVTKGRSPNAKDAEPKTKRKSADAKQAGKAAKAEQTREAEGKSKRAATQVVRGPFTLAIDVGGSGLKASVLDAAGQMVTERVRVETPHPCTPAKLIAALVALVKPLPHWDRVSVGFPGLIRHGVVITAPNLSTRAFAGFDLKAALESALAAPVRAVNDADMQGLAAIAGKGVEMVVTLGTGFGTALFQDGKLQVHLEIAHLPFRKGKTYDQEIGDKNRRKLGNAKWSERVKEALHNVFVLTHYDHLYVGGGNARELVWKGRAKNITLVDNAAGILGGIRLWDDLLEDV
jgi:polyphosphate glucokinase